MCDTVFPRSAFVTHSHAQSGMGVGGCYNISTPLAIWNDLIHNSFAFRLLLMTR